jgi:hypothetical protein
MELLRRQEENQLQIHSILTVIAANCHFLWKVNGGSVLGATSDFIGFPGHLSL